MATHLTLTTYRNWRKCWPQRGHLNVRSQRTLRPINACVALSIAAHTANTAINKVIPGRLRSTCLNPYRHTFLHAHYLLLKKNENGIIYWSIDAAAHRIRENAHCFSNSVSARALAHNRSFL